MLDRLRPIAEKVAERLQKAGQRGRTVTLKLKSHDHDVTTRRTTLERPVDSEEAVMTLAERLLRRPHPPEDPVRLLEISVSSLASDEVKGKQLKFDFKK
jgi:DNA polymerase-4